MALNDTEERRRQAQEWLATGNPEQRAASLEYLARGRKVLRWCPENCGCALGPDRDGKHDADLRGCGCDGLCTGEG